MKNVTSTRRDSAARSAAAARAGALAEKMEAEAEQRKRARSESDVGQKKPTARRAAPGLTDMMAACARAPDPEPEPEAPPSPVVQKKKKKKKPKKKPEDAPDEILTIVVRDRRKESDGEDTTVKLKISTKLQVFSAYADGKGASVDALRFLFKGGDVYSDESPGGVGLKEGDTLDCVDGEPAPKKKPPPKGKRLTGTVARWDRSWGGIEPAEPPGGHIAVRASSVRRGTTLHVGDKVEYAVGRKGDARFALDVMVYAPVEDDDAAVAAVAPKGEGVVSLANLSYDTKRYDLKEHVKTIVGGGFGRVDLTAKGRATVAFRTRS